MGETALTTTEKSKTIRKDLKARFDGWINVLTGLGIKNKDKRTGMSVEWASLTEVDTETLYAADDVAGRVVDILPDQATMKWIDIKAKDKQVAEDITKATEKLALDKHFNQAGKWARMYGGSAILLGTTDQDLSKPLFRTAQINSLTVLSRWELYPGEIQTDPTKSGYGLPETYQLQLRTGDTKALNTMSYIHASRLLRFDGVVLPRRLHIQNNYWGDSVLTRLYNVLRNFNSSHDSVASVIQDFRIAVMKLKNLADMIASGDDAAVLKRLDLVNLSKSVARMVVLDENEVFEHQQTSLAGLKEVLEKVDMRLVAATGMPHTVILGESPGGMGRDGKHEETIMNDLVKSYQQTQFQPQLDRFFQVLLTSTQGPTSGQIPEGFAYEFTPLWQMDEKEEAEIKKINMETDTGYIEHGVLDPNEVAISRFGGEAYGKDINIESELRAPVPPLPPGEVAQSGSQTEIKTKQEISLNGAQVTSLLDIVTKVAYGVIPKESGLSMIKTAFSLSDEQATAIMSTIGSGFKPTPQEQIPKVDVDLDGGEGSGGAREGAGRKKGSGQSAEAKQTFKMMGSAGSEEQIKGLLDKFFYNSTPQIQLKPNGENQWSVWNGEKHIEGSRVIKKGGRYRFERQVDAADDITEDANDADKARDLQTIIVSKEVAKTLEEAKKIAEGFGHVGKVDETETSFRFRQKDPTEFNEKTFRTFKPAKNGVTLVFGTLKG